MEKKHAKGIRLSEETYNRLDAFRLKRESFGQAVDRLLDMLEKVGELRNVLEGHIAFREGQRERLEKLTEGREA